MSAEKTGVGVIGCGNISGIYFTNLTTVFENTKVVACADVLPERAKEAAEKYSIPKACSVEELLADPDVKITVNLTIPKAHTEVALKSLQAGKHTHGEKPLTLTREEAQELLALAEEKSLRVGAAPDTFMGAGLQTCRKLLDEGAIGRPVAATAFLACHGHESWHPAPEFYYKPGGGPMFDMGPYYLTALVSLLGPVRRVSGSTQISFPQRTITSEPLNGTIIDVAVPTHVAGVLDFACGTVASVITSFDIWGHNLPCIEIYGTEGTLCVPDPNCFGGAVRVRRAEDGEWKEVPLSHAHEENSRGIGVADMAAAITSGRAHRASGELAYHVLDIMQAFHDASDQDRAILLQSSCERPAPLQADLPTGKIDP